MNRITLSLIVAAGLLFNASALADEQIETFDEGIFTNSFFNHELEFDLPCCWEIVQFGPDFELHLRPNTDLITFNLAPGEKVQSVSTTILDLEGGFVGDSPTSVMVVRAAKLPLHFWNNATGCKQGDRAGTRPTHEASG